MRTVYSNTKPRFWDTYAIALGKLKQKLHSGAATDSAGGVTPFSTCLPEVPDGKTRTVQKMLLCSDEGAVTEHTVEAVSYTETYVDGSRVIVHWATPGVTFLTGVYEIYRDGALIGTAPSGSTSFDDTTVVTSVTYEYRVDFVYMS